MNWRYSPAQIRWCLLVCLLAVALPLRAATARPFLLLFPIGVVENAESLQNKDAVSVASMRALRASRILRDQFKENRTAEVLLYDADSPMIQRALIENKITLVENAMPSESERFAIAKSIGATHVLLVLSPPSSDGADIELQSVEVANRRKWASRSKAVATGGAPEVSSKNDVASALRVLMLRYVNGPLKEYVRGAVPSDLVPNPSNPLHEPEVYKVEPEKPTETVPVQTPVVVSKPVGKAVQNPIEKPTLPPTETKPVKPAELFITEKTVPVKPKPDPKPMKNAGTVVKTPTVTQKPVAAVKPTIETKKPDVIKPTEQAVTPLVIPVKSPDTPVAKADPAVETPAVKPELLVEAANTSKIEKTVPTAIEPAATFGAKAGEDDQAKAWREEAESLIGAGDVNGAIALLRKAVNRSPLTMASRADLIRAYLLTKRNGDAASEARRAFALISDDTERMKLVALVNTALSGSETAQAAQNIYSDILNSNPEAVWAHVARGDLLRQSGRTGDAEKEYRIALKTEPQNRAAKEGLATVLADSGDLPGALDLLTSGRNSATERSQQAGILFDRIAPRIADALTENRRVWQQGQIRREAFYQATQRQQVRMASFVALLNDTAPPATNMNAKWHQRRLLAAAALTEAAASLLVYLESNEASASDRANLNFSTYRREMGIFGGQCQVISARKVGAGLPRR